jgi:PelA/Pel-15E family pectate lyase
VKGKLTAWCAQHDEIDGRPRPARSYELVSLSGSESVGIIRLLMSLDQPDAATVAAVEGAVAWLESVKITGHKWVEVEDKSMPGGKDRHWVEDAGAPPQWARFYEIETNRPMFCDRDGVVKYSVSEIGHERRNGYAWLGNWPQKLVESEYPQWRKSRLKVSP